MPQYYPRQFPEQTSPYAYELPDQRYLQVPGEQTSPQGPGQPPPPVGGPGEALAEVEGLTDKYFNTWGKLNSFADSMWKEWKIDVTKPDLSQPGGGVPFQSYQRLAAEVMRTANHLGNKQKETVQMRPYTATGQVVKRGDQYETQALLPEVEDVLNKLKGPFYNQADAERAKKQFVGPMLQQLLERGDLDDPLVRHNIEVLRGANTTHSTYPGLYTFQPKDDKLELLKQKSQLKAVASASREVGALKRFTALKNGFWSDGSAKVENIVGDDGTSKPALVNYAHSGELFGKTIVSDNSSGDAVGKQVNQIVDKWVRRPDKSVWIYFKPDPESGFTPPPQRVDTENGVDITAKFQQINPKFGQSNPMFQAVDIMGWSDPNNVGSLNEEAMYNADSPTGYQSLSASRDRLDQMFNSREAKSLELKSSLDRAINDTGLFGSGTVDIPLPDGSKIKVSGHKIGDGFYIEGYNKEHLTPAEVEKYLETKGFFSPSLQTNPQPVKTGEETEGAYQLRLNRWKKSAGSDSAAVKKQISPTVIPKGTEYVEEGWENWPNIFNGTYWIPVGDVGENPDLNDPAVMAKVRETTEVMNRLIPQYRNDPEWSKRFKYPKK